MPRSPALVRWGGHRSSPAPTPRSSKIMSQGDPSPWRDVDGNHTPVSSRYNHTPVSSGSSSYSASSGAHPGSAIKGWRPGAAGDSPSPWRGIERSFRAPTDREIMVLQVGTWAALLNQVHILAACT